MRTIVLTVLLTILFVLTATAQPRSTPKAAKPVPGIILVKFAPEALGTPRLEITPADLRTTAAAPLRQRLRFTRGRKVFRDFQPADTLATSRTGEPVRLIDLSRWYTLKVADTTDIATLAERLADLPGVESAVPEYLLTPDDVFPDDPEFQQGNQWGFNNPYYTGNDIHAPAAWEYNKGRSDVVVAVVDGGVDYTHSDLDPGNRSRVIQGYDTADNDSDPMDDIPAGQGFADHGTQVAGTIGAITDNGNDIAGVLWNAQIMPIKVAFTDGPWWDPFDLFAGAGSATRTNVGQGIDHARSHGADIINLSLGSPAEDAPGTWELFFIGNPVGEAVWNAYQQGVTVFASSGNDYDAQVGFPASHPGAIAVGASTLSDQRHGYSNYGERLDFVAPSGFVSTSRGESVDGFSGTSQAAPVASGVGGLILSESRDLGLGLTNDDIRHLMQQTADDVNATQYPGRDDRIGHGRINAEAALQALQPPNTVTQASATGGSSSVVWDDHKHIFYNNGYLPSGSYPGVETHKVTGHVTFSQPYESTPLVWIRERATEGWSAASPNRELPYAKITNVTATGFDYETYVYWIPTDLSGDPVNRFYPASPSQATVAYTVVGEPAPPEPLTVSIFGPEGLGWKAQGTWTAHASGGSGSTSYRWYQRSGGSGYWQNTGETTQSITRTMVYNNGLELKAEVTRGTETAYDTHFVEYCTSGSFCGLDPFGNLVAAGAAEPTDYALAPAYPNPFNPRATIRFALPEATDVELIVYDVLGREVARLVDGPMQAGRHEATFEAGNLPSGVYLYELRAGDFRETGRMMLAK